VLTFRSIKQLLFATALLVSAVAEAGYTSASTFNGSTAPHFSRVKAIAVDSSFNTWAGGDFDGGTLKFGTTSISSPRSAAFLFKRTSSGSFPVVLKFETVTLGDEVQISGVAVDATGKVSVCGFFKGKITIGTTTLTSSAPSGLYSIFFAQISSSGSILQAISSTNSDNSVSGKLVVDGSNNVYMTGFYKGTVSLAGLSLTSASSNEGFILKISPTGTGLSKQVTSGTGTHFTTIWSASVNPADGSIFVAGNFQNNAKFGSTTLTAAANNGFVAKLDSSLNWVGAVAPSFSGTVTLASFAEANDVQVSGTSVFVTGRFQTGSAGVALAFGPSILVSSGMDTYVATLNTTTPLAFSSANLGHTSDGAGKALARSPSTGTVWNTGVIRNSANFSGTIVNATGYNHYLTSVSPASVYANVTASSPGNNGGGAITRAIAIGSNGQIVVGGEIVGTENFGSKKLTASSTSAYIAFYTP
jgi:hypothetical protein